MTPTIIFDLDGTLADTAADMLAAANAALAGAGHGAPLTLEADRATAMRGGRAMLALGLSRAGASAIETQVDAVYPAFLEGYSAQLRLHTKLYPGVAGTLARLAGEGYALGVCTNKPAALAARLLAGLGLGTRLPALVGAGTLAVKKPDPAAYGEAVARAGGDMARSMLIGDTVTDVDTARAAGVPCVLVAFGPEGRGISRLAPDALLEDYTALPGLAESLLSERIARPAR